ncbi:MAG: NAD(P)H-dependent oxidoreductase subunit E [Candidatus Omnitrophica bacterium]|nr:NAD(P)H-dependent oxidoreductase subunit E [Candidatus Omnitrophota bacterium]
MNKDLEEKAIDLSVISKIISDHQPFSQEEVISSLQEIQDSYGYLPKEAIDELAELTGTPVAKIYGVVTFYSGFFLTPHGKHSIKMCRGTACHVKKAPKILSAISGYLGIKDGETTDDMLFSLESIACLGTCFLSPIMLIGNQYYGKLTPKSAIKILEGIAKEEQDKK